MDKVISDDVDACPSERHILNLLMVEQVENATWMAFLWLLRWHGFDVCLSGER